LDQRNLSRPLWYRPHQRSQIKGADVLQTDANVGKTCGMGSKSLSRFSVWNVCAHDTGLALHSYNTHVSRSISWPKCSSFWMYQGISSNETLTMLDWRSAPITHIAMGIAYDLWRPTEFETMPQRTPPNMHQRSASALARMSWPGRL